MAVHHTDLIQEINGFFMLTEKKTVNGLPAFPLTGLNRRTQANF